MPYGIGKVVRASSGRRQKVLEIAVIIVWISNPTGVARGGLVDAGESLCKQARLWNGLQGKPRGICYPVSVNFSDGLLSLGSLLKMEEVVEELNCS